MKTHTSQFKDKIKEFGRELDSKITYTIGGTTTELGSEQLNSVSPHYEGAILKSVMKQLDIDSNIEIPVGTELNYQFGVKTRTGKNLFSSEMEIGTIDNSTGANASSNNCIRSVDYIKVEPNTKYTLSNILNYNCLVHEYAEDKTYIQYDGNYSAPRTFTTTANTHYIRVRSSAGSVQNDLNGKYQLELGNTATSYEAYGMYDYINYGNYIVKEIEKQEDTRSWKITCYDKMLYSMKEYENSNIVFPITIRDYINAISSKLGLTFKNASDTFANYDKTISNELFLDSEGRSMNYTFRDVLDQLAEVTASTICIDKDDELEIRYVQDTQGKNLLKNDATSQVVNYVTFTVNADKSITINGTASGRADLYLFGSSTDTGNYLYVPRGTYVINTQNLVDGRLFLAFREKTAGTKYATITNDSAITLMANQDCYFYGVMLGFENGQTATNLTIYPQLEAGTQTTSYEPYGDTIDEEYLKDVNVNFGEKFGPVNTIVLSRGGDGDKISLSEPSNLPDENKIAIQISDNQIMNGNDRNTYMADILNKLYNLEYYMNDYTSTGICYYDLCDRYNVKVDNNYYSCIMFNDSVEVTQGLQESIYTDMQEENEQDYKYMSSTDRGITQANIIANKVEGTITEYTQRLNEDESRINAVETKQTDTERTINVISTNIDANGNITEVTTTTGFTFNADGMTIHKSDSSFYALHRDDGTYYYDGGTSDTNIVGQYTKDGSKQKDLALFGVYYYGMDEYDDTPMFVAQLYTDKDGNECFGHFYNRGD